MKTTNFSDIYNLPTIQNGFLNVVVPNTRLIQTHLERLFFGSIIAQTAKDDESVTFHIKSPIWYKGKPYNAFVKFYCTRTKDNQYFVNHITETSNEQI